jgi:hypothetical protein
MFMTLVNGENMKLLHCKLCESEAVQILPDDVIQLTHCSSRDCDLNDCYLDAETWNNLMGVHDDIKTVLTILSNGLLKMPTSEDLDLVRKILEIYK